MDAATLIAQAQQFALERQWGLAIKCARQAVEIDARDVNAHYILGKILRLAGEPRDAVVHLEEASELAPTVAAVHDALGSALHDVGRFDAAEAAFLRAVDLDPNLTGAHYNLGRLRGQVLSNTVLREIAGSYHKLQLINLSGAVYSCNDEQLIIRDILNLLPDVEHFCVDIGASDGVSLSNSFRLFENGWVGLAVEPRKEMFARLAENLQFATNVVLVRGYATEQNVVALLSAHNVPRRFGFLTLDIDSYDYFVLEALLASYAPALICVEINERIPPPIRMALRPGGKNTLLTGGASIASFGQLFSRFGYSIVALEYNNAIVVHDDYREKLLPRYVPMTAEQAWRIGYRDRPDRRMKFPWNETYSFCIEGEPMAVFEKLNEILADQRQFIDLSID